MNDEDKERLARFTIRQEYVKRFISEMVEKVEGEEELELLNDALFYAKGCHEKMEQLSEKLGVYPF